MWPSRKSAGCRIILFLASLTTIPIVKSKVSGRNVQRSIKISNESEAKFEVFWVKPNSDETVLMSQAPVVQGMVYTLDSYVGHEFLIKEVPSSKTNACKFPEKGCRSTRFAVNENDDQLAKITQEFRIEFIDNKVKARKEAGQLLETCKETANKLGDSSDPAVAKEAMTKLVQCVEEGVAESLEEVNEEIAFQASVRTDIAAKLENYTCLDDTLGSTDDVETRSWLSPRDGNSRVIHVKHERPSSRIHVIENFINADECTAMEEAAASSLHRATVADGKGGSRLSENRKAMQAGITVPWDKEADDHPIARISRRVFDYTNHVLGLSLDEHGQEDLMSIQYFGRGTNDTEPDRYTPHCDGDCTGMPHKDGTRMATMVMYCTVADLGGHTNFRNSGVHVKPQAGNGIFFSYINPETKIMDTGFTEHSGCPVFEGQKKIVTQWIRLGVDAQNPWDSFNTLGIKHSEMQEDEDVIFEGSLEEADDDSFEEEDDMEGELGDDQVEVDLSGDSL